jgi:hypothetical protein
MIREDKVITQKNLIMERVKSMIKGSKERSSRSVANAEAIAFEKGYRNSLEILLLDLKYDGTLKTQVEEIL